MRTKDWRHSQDEDSHAHYWVYFSSCCGTMKLIQSEYRRLGREARVGGRLPRRLYSDWLRKIARRNPGATVQYLLGAGWQIRSKKISSSRRLWLGARSGDYTPDQYHVQIPATDRKISWVQRNMAEAIFHKRYFNHRPCKWKENVARWFFTWTSSEHCNNEATFEHVTERVACERSLSCLSRVSSAYPKAITGNTRKDK